MPLERVSPELALAMLARVHRRNRPPNPRIVAELVRQMKAADEASAVWDQTTTRSVVLSRQDGVIFGREVLLALVCAHRERLLLVERGAGLTPYLHEVDPEVEPAMASNGVHLDSALTIDTWMHGPGQRPGATP